MAGWKIPIFNREMSILKICPFPPPAMLVQGRRVANWHHSTTVRSLARWPNSDKSISNSKKKMEKLGPIGSMHGIFTYIWLKFMVNVGKYAIHGSYGGWNPPKNLRQIGLFWSLKPDFFRDFGVRIPLILNHHNTGWETVGWLEKNIQKKSLPHPPTTNPDRGLLGKTSEITNRHVGRHSKALMLSTG